MNRYGITDEMRNTFLPTIKQFIEKVENREDKLEYIELDFTNKGISPYQIWGLLEELGYESRWKGDNGWQLDFWWDFNKEGCTTIKMFGTGIMFEVKIYVGDE